MASKFAGLQKSEAPARMYLRDPDTKEQIIRTDGEPAWIELYPSQSKFAAQVDRRIQDENIRRGIRRMGGKDLDTVVVKRLAMLTKDWSLVGDDGSPVDVPCTAENAMELYAEVIWLREAVSDFVSDLGNFQPRPSTNSSTSPSMSSDSPA